MFHGACTGDGVLGGKCTNQLEIKESHFFELIDLLYSFMISSSSSILGQKLHIEVDRSTVVCLE